MHMEKNLIKKIIKLILKVKNIKQIMDMNLIQLMIQLMIH